MLHMEIFVDILHDATDYANRASRHASRLACDTDLTPKPHNETLLFDYIKMLNDAVTRINDYATEYMATKEKQS